MTRPSVPPASPPQPALDRELLEASAGALASLAALDIDDEQALARTVDRVHVLLARLEPATSGLRPQTVTLLRTQVGMLRRTKPSRRRPVALQLDRHLAVFIALRLIQATSERGGGAPALRWAEAEPALARYLSTPLQAWLALG